MSTWQPEHPELAEYDPQVTPFFTGYRIDLEPREIARQEMLAATNLWHATAMSTQWEKPKEIDPRGWFDIHNQGAQGSCFPAGHKVAMADGTTKNIEDVRVGDEVLTHLGRSRRVLTLMQRNYAGLLVRIRYGATWMTMTEDHKILVDGEWKAAHDLTDSDSITWGAGMSDGQETAIDEVGHELAGTTVYDFEVQEDHSFICNGIAVHNCQGQSLADALEYVHVMAHGEEIQISRSFAYLASQEFDGLLGRDAGSTLQGGSKAAERGLPLESLFAYDVNYRSALSKYRSQKNDILNGPLFKLRGRVNLESYDACYNWLASWSGVIQIGIDWSVRLRNGWEIHEYRPGGGGGHAILLCGYLPINGENWILLKNSHSTQWGKDGWAVVKPSAIDQMCRARWSSIVGRSDMVAPTVRPERLDNYRARIAA